MGQLSENIIGAHGGRQRWQQVDRLMASLAMGGMAFMPHFHLHALRDVEASVSPHRGQVTLAPFPRAGQIGAFDGEQLWIETEAGELISSRSVPSPSAKALRYWSFWDELDRLYVVALTVWHAMLLPWLLTHSEVVEKPGGTANFSGIGRVSRLEVTFPEALVVPATTQTLYADTTGLVRRVDYTPHAYGGWLRVGQVMAGFEAVNGLVLPCEQTLYPSLMNNQVWRASRFLWLTLADPMVAYRG